jgi:hypothetical protein
MDAIREVIATLYLAMAYAGGPQWLDRANEMLVENAGDPEMNGEAAHMLRTLAEQSSGLYPIQPECQQWPAIQLIWRELEPETAH